jgi:hypothetical protein
LSDAVVRQIRGWVEDCKSHSQCHDSCEPSRLPLRVVDVDPPDGTRDPRLTAGDGKIGYYITLSYRWGNTGSLTTTSKTKSEREAGMPIDTLPLTMRDAVTIARRLKIRYLWIDALCILQDSDTDWNEQSAKMGDIYQNAWLNISADVSEHSNAGILARRNPLDIQNCEHPTLLSSTAGYKKVICPFVGDVMHVVNKNILTERGWIFAERLFSKRIIHWSYHEVIWECNTLLASERQPTRVSYGTVFAGIKWGKIRGIAQHSTNAQLHDLIRNPKGTCSSELAKAEYYAPWYLLITEYSKRSFTQWSDKLPAISGLASRFNQGLQNPLKPSEYLGGLWIDDISCGLAWSVDWTLESTINARSSRRFDPSNTTSPYIGPSFSWISVDRSVRFYDNTVSCYIDKNVQLEVLEINKDLADSDPFGKMIGGYLKIKAQTLRLSVLHNQIPPGTPGHYDYIFDHMDTKKYFRGLIPQVLLVYLGKGDTNMLYIMLLPVDDKALSYYRIGLLRINSSSCGFRVMDIVII